MAEPASSSAAGAAAAVTATALTATALMPLDPWLREALVIVGAGLFGSLWPLSGAAGLTRTQGAMLVLRLVGTSAALTGAAAWWVHREWDVPTAVTLSPLAFAIAAAGDAWRDPVAMWRRLRALFPGGKG